MDGLTVTTVAARPDLAAKVWDEINSKGWAEFMFHDPVADEFFGELIERFAELQPMIHDADDRLVLAANCVPFRWDGPVEELPDTGWDWALSQSVREHRAGVEPTMVSAIQIVVRRDLLGSGLAARGLEAMRSIVAGHGFADLVAPVRPNFKHRYPLTPMERYVAWTRGDGLPFDPWMRVHVRAGARIVKVAPQSMRVVGTVAQWQEWTGLTFPESGRYVIPDALTPITVDIEADEGVYVEPNVWMHHTLG